jgi:hypothetical protein
MVNLRFSTVKQIADAFPLMAKDLVVSDPQLHPVKAVEQLAQEGETLRALTLCAYMLPRREAVQWLCECLQEYRIGFSFVDADMLKLAETWIKNSSEKNRSAAFAAAMDSGFLTAPAWAAAAVGWSGGNISPDPEKPVPPFPYLTGQAVKTAFLIGYWNLFGDERDAKGKNAVDRALALVHGSA